MFRDCSLNSIHNTTDTRVHIMNLSAPYFDIMYGTLYFVSHSGLCPMMLICEIVSTQFSGVENMDIYVIMVVMTLVAILW